MRRSVETSGSVLIEKQCNSADCVVPVCSEIICPSLDFPFEVPGDASSLQIILESFTGDADLFLATPLAAQVGASMNGGPGFDILQLGPEVVVPLRGETLTVELESWQQQTQDYSLRVAYNP